MNISENRVKSLLLLIGVLVISNAILAFMLFQKSNWHRPKSKSEFAKNYLKEELKFNDTQIENYTTAEKFFFEDHIRSIANVQKLREANLKTVGAQQFSQIAIDSAIVKSAAFQEKNSRRFWDFMIQVRNICTPEQKAKFDTSFYKMFPRSRERK